MKLDHSTSFSQRGGEPAISLGAAVPRRAIATQTPPWAAGGQAPSPPQRRRRRRESRRASAARRRAAAARRRRRRRRAAARRARGEPLLRQSAGWAEEIPRRAARGRGGGRALRARPRARGEAPRPTAPPEYRIQRGGFRSVGGAVGERHHGMRGEDDIMRAGGRCVVHCVQSTARVQLDTCPLERQWSRRIRIPLLGWRGLAPRPHRHTRRVRGRCGGLER